MSGVCSRCLCTEDNACDLGGGEPCAWFDAEKTLCTGCVTDGDVPDTAPFIYIPFPSGSKETSS